MSKDEASTAVIDGGVIEEALRRCQELDEQEAQNASSEAERDLGPGLVGAHEAITRENMIPAQRAIDTTSPTETGHPAVDVKQLDVERVPEPAMAPHEVPWHALDHRAGYLLRQVDGQRTYREIIEASGIEPSEARDLLATLLDMGCIAQR